MAGSQVGAGKRPSESMLASASVDSTPRVGIVLSSFRGATEHDGSHLAGLSDPRPVDSDLTLPQIEAMLRKAMELGSRGRRGGLPPVAPDEWVVLKVRIAPLLSTDSLWVQALLRTMVDAKRGKRFTIAAAAPVPPNYRDLITDFSARYSNLRFSYVNLLEDGYLQSAAPRRTFAARNPEAVYALSRTLRECDRLITFSPLATSKLTGVSLSVSNYWDFAPAEVYGAKREKLRDLGDPVDVLTDLYLHHPPDYAILAGSVHRDEAGEVRHNIAIAGTNALAVDTVGAAVMGFTPARLPLLDKLEARGFGVANPDVIWTRGNEIDEARRSFRRPAPWDQS